MSNKKDKINEVNLMKNLRHNSIVKILETIETDKYILIIMENVSGGDLLSFVKKRSQLPEKTAKLIFRQLMLALKVDAIVDEVEAEINAGRHPVIALESTMESSIKDYAAGEIIDEPTFSASLLKGLDSVMQYTITDENGKKINKRYSPQELGPAGEKAYYELQDFIRESTSDIFISPLDAIIKKARNAKDGDKFIALFDNGVLSEYNNDDSAADLALCSILAFYTNGNKEQIHKQN